MLEPVPAFMFPYLAVTFLTMGLIASGTFFMCVSLVVCAPAAVASRRREHHRPIQLGTMR